MISKVKFRQVAESDLPALEWNGEYQHFRQIYKDMFLLSLRGEAMIWIAEWNKQKLIGQVLVQLKSARIELADGKTRAYIFGFRIKPDYRNLGIGSKFMLRLEDELVEKGYEWAILNVNQDNMQARNLYERLGYKVVAEEAGIWNYIDDKGKRRDVNEPAWRMEKKLT
ncbi:MAG: GNAT family N-acetyltransferase [Anaerolineales bacterium]|nr:GNAT family N-acetyltransferase [Anaerolineales bacterium]